MSRCSKCRTKFNTKELTEYATTEYRSLCGRCIFKEIDRLTMEEMLEAGEISEDTFEAMGYEHA